MGYLCNRDRHERQSCFNNQQKEQEESLTTNAAFPEVETDEEEDEMREKENEENADDEDEDESMDSDDEDYEEAVENDSESYREWFLGISASRSERCSKSKLCETSGTVSGQGLHLERLLRPKRWMFYYRLTDESCEGCMYTSKMVPSSQAWSCTSRSHEHPKSLHGRGIYGLRRSCGSSRR